MEWLKDKFNNRVISRMMPERVQLCRLFGLLVPWSIALVEQRRIPHTDIDDLKQTVEHVESFEESTESEDVKKAVHYLRHHAL